MLIKFIIDSVSGCRQPINLLLAAKMLTLRVHPKPLFLIGVRIWAKILDFWTARTQHNTVWGSRIHTNMLCSEKGEQDGAKKIQYRWMLFCVISVNKLNNICSWIINTFVLNFPPSLFLYPNYLLISLKGSTIHFSIYNII